MTPPEVSAVIVTRGDVCMEEIVTSLKRAEFGEILICDNAKRVAEGQEDLGVYGMYYTMLHAAQNPIIYYQDDDVVVEDPGAIVAAWKPGVITCNMSAKYRQQYINKIDRLMGFGSVFERSLIPPTFQRYLQAGYTMDSVFCREPSRLFTALNKTEMVDVPKRHLPWATDPSRLYRQPNHGTMRDNMRERAQHILDMGL